MKPALEVLFGGFGFEDAADEFFLLRRKPLHVFRFLLHGGTKGGVFHFQLVQLFALFVAFGLKGIALAALAGELLLRAGAYGIERLLALRGICLLVFERAELLFQLLQRVAIDGDIPVRLRDLLEKRLFALFEGGLLGARGLIFGAERLHLLLGLFPGRFTLCDGAFELLDIFLLAGDIFAAFLNFAFVGEQRARVLTAAAARHRAAGHDGIAVERHDLKGIAVLFRNRVGVEDIVADERVAQKVADDVIVIIVVLHQFGGEPQGALFVERALNFARIGPRAHAGDGQESDDAAVGALEVLDQPARVVRGRRHDVLHGAAERRLHGRLVLLFGAHDVRQGAFDAVAHVGIGFGHGKETPHRILVSLEAIF